MTNSPPAAGFRSGVSRPPEAPAKGRRIMAGSKVPRAILGHQVAGSFLFLLFSLMSSLLFSGCTTSKKTAPTCPGDPRCVCDDSGNCAICGDFTCAYPETCSTCEADCEACGECGDGTCSLAETCGTCPADCGFCGECGDAICDEDEEETCETCPADCGICPARCGDAICASNETCRTCEEDCGVCPATCGNGLCDMTEDCRTCPDECGTCVPHCGDGYCLAEEQEGCHNCPGDCGPCDAGGGCFPKDAPGCTDCGCGNCVCLIEPGC